MNPMRYEFTGGVSSPHGVRVGPLWIRLVVTPAQLGFRGRGPLAHFIADKWTIPREQVTEVYAKKRNILPPRVWDIEIVTTDPSVWWTFWSPRDPGPALLAMKECGYPVDWALHNWAGASLD